MPRITRTLIAASLPLVALGGLAAPPSPASADAGEATHYYLSLGDSLAESSQPDGGSHPRLRRGSLQGDPR